MRSPDPLLDTELAGQLFSASNEAERAELNDMFRAMVADVYPRIRKLEAFANGGDVAEATREIHQIRGVTANFGFCRAAAKLARLEAGWKDMGSDARTRGLQAAAADMKAGADELVRAFPYLASVIAKENS